MFRGAAAWHAGTGMTKFDAPEYRKLMEDAETSYDQDERKPKYKAMIQYIQDQSFVIPVLAQSRVLHHALAGPGLHHGWRVQRLAAAGLG